MEAPDVSAGPPGFLEIDVCNPMTYGRGRARYTDYEVRARVGFMRGVLVLHIVSADKYFFVSLAGIVREEKIQRLRSPEG